MTKSELPGVRYAVCVQSDDAGALTPRMIYELLPDPDAERSSYLRVIDNEGEDYLYPASYFVELELPAAAERALRRAS